MSEEPVRYAPPLEESLPVLVQSVKAQGFDGLVANRRDSVYEAGERSGAEAIRGEAPVGLLRWRFLDCTKKSFALVRRIAHLDATLTNKSVKGEQRTRTLTVEENTRARRSH